MEGIQLSLFGKTCPEPSAATKVKTSDAFSKISRKSQAEKYLYLDLRMEGGWARERSWETVTVSPGAYSTRNTGECPRDEKESTLSQILQENAPERYYLSATACQGILNRAKKRGKELPTMLKEALEEVIALNALQTADTHAEM